MATVVTDRDDEYFKECKVEVAGKKTRTHVNLDGVFWTK